MYVRNKKIIQSKLDEICVKGRLMISGANNNVALLNDLINEVISIGELLTHYGKTGADLIDKLEHLAIDIESIRVAYKKEKSIRINVANLIFHVKKIKDRVEEGIPNDKKLAFFLPYKASMWDSLESIWTAAKQDENWEAVVMPIPYFDRACDGTIKAWHWEGNDFPENIPIVDYRKINLQEVHPDEVYIHNPYDAYNIVTSVHPDYYSDKLKKITDKLIYIPYFVSDENTATPQWAEKHARMPVFVHADIIILQSNRMRDIYIESLVNLYGENTRNIWSSKIKGWGSPKLEKVAQDRRENQEIPESWLKKIIKSDGSWKKVIMYGTGLSEMLRSNEKLLNKIENTLAFFQKRKDSVMMLWRPHPLILATLESMRPELLARYIRIVDDFKKADWGIWDDTTDLHRSISISDAYYGDDSSVISLFQAARKPVMLEAIDLMN